MHIIGILIIGVMLLLAIGFAACGLYFVFFRQSAADDGAINIFGIAEFRGSQALGLAFMGLSIYLLSQIVGNAASWRDPGTINSGQNGTSVTSFIAPEVSASEQNPIKIALPEASPSATERPRSVYSDLPPLDERASWHLIVRGCGDAAALAYKVKRLKRIGFVQADKNVAFFDDCPSWISKTSTVYYYDKTNRDAARAMARFLKQDGSEPYMADEGDGEGVEVGDYSRTFVLHLIAG